MWLTISGTNLYALKVWEVNNSLTIIAIEIEKKIATMVSRFHFHWRHSYLVGDGWGLGFLFRENWPCYNPIHMSPIHVQVNFSLLPVCVAKQPVWKILGTGPWEESHKIFPLCIVTVHWTFISLKPYWVIRLGIRGAMIVYCYVIKWEVSYSPSIHATMPRIRSESDWGCQDVRSQGISMQGINLVPMEYRADSRFEPSQWEMSLQSNVISQWLGANLESALEHSIAQKKGRF